MKILANKLDLNTHKFTKILMEFPIGHKILKLDVKYDEMRIIFSVPDEFENYKIFNQKETRKIYIVGTGVEFRGVTVKDDKMYDEDNHEIKYLDFARLQDEFGYSVFYSEVINKNENDVLSDEQKEELKQNLLALLNSINNNEPNSKINLKEVVDKINDLSPAQKEALQVLLNM